MIYWKVKLASGRLSRWILHRKLWRLFDFLKTRCVTALVLAFADFEKPFVLETDTSSCGLGAVLSQKQDDDKYHPGRLC